MSPHVNVSAKQSNSTFTVIGTSDHATNQTYWQDVAAGYASSYGIRDDGTLWSWGTLWSNPEREAALKDGISKRKLGPAFFRPPTQIGTDSR